MKGFTLIEILAVTVILAVILLISVPTIGGIVGSVRKNAFETSVNIIAKIAETEAMVPGSVYKNGVTITYLNGEAVDADLPYNGKRPESGVINISPQGQVELALFDGEYCVRKSYSSSKTSSFKSTEEECTIEGRPLITRVESGIDYSLLLDADKNLYFNYELGSKNILLGELADSGSEENMQYGDAVLLVMQLLIAANHVFPDTVEGVVTLTNSVVFKNAIYYYHTDEEGFMDDLRNEYIDPTDLYNVDENINTAYLNDPSLVSKYNSIKQSFTIIFSAEDNVDGISDFLFNLYQIFSLEGPTLNLTMFLQEYLPIIGYVSHTKTDFLIGFNIFTYMFSSRSFQTIKDDIASVSENQAFLDLIMDVYYKLTGGEFNFPPQLSSLDSKTLDVVYSIFVNELSTSPEMTLSMINGQQFKNAVYCSDRNLNSINTCMSSTSQSAIDSYYLSNPSLTDLHNAIKTRATEMLLVSNDPINVAALAKYEYIANYYEYMVLTDGSVESFIESEVIKTLIQTAFIATGNNWIPAYHYNGAAGVSDTDAFYEANKDNPIFIQYLNDLKTSLSAIINFAPSLTSEQKLASKLLTLASDVTIYSKFLIEDIRIYDSYGLDMFMKEGEYEAFVYFIFSRGSNWSMILEDSNPSLPKPASEQLSDPFFQEYLSKFSNNLRKMFLFSEKPSLTIKSNYSNIKDMKTLRNTAFIVHDNGDVSVIGEYNELTYDTFTKLSNVTNVKKIVSTSSNEMFGLYFIREDGSVYDVARYDFNSATLLADLSNVRDIVFNESDEGIFAIHYNGTVSIWGTMGRDRNGSNIDIESPVNLPLLNDVKDLAFNGSESDNYYGIAILNDNSIRRIEINDDFVNSDPYDDLFEITDPRVPIDMAYASNYNIDYVSNINNQYNTSQLLNSNLNKKNYHLMSNDLVYAKKMGKTTENLPSIFIPKAVSVVSYSKREWNGENVTEGYIIKTPTGEYYGLGFNSNGIMNGPFAPNYWMESFTDLGINGTAFIFANDNFALRIDSSNNAYYSGSNDAKLFGLQPNYIDNNHNEWILGFKKIENLQLKLYSYYNKRMSEKCYNQTHTLVTMANEVKRYSLNLCGHEVTEY